MASPSAWIISPSTGEIAPIICENPSTGSPSASQMRTPWKKPLIAPNMHESVARSQAAALPIGSPMCWMLPAMASSSGRQAARARASPEMKSGVSGRPIWPGVASRAPSR